MPTYISLKNSLLDFAICPYCHDEHLKLSQTSTLLCSNENCQGHQTGFNILDEQPVLVDFDRSVFNRENYATGISGKVVFRRKGLFHKLIGRILHGDSKVSQKNINDFISLTLSTASKPVVLVVGGGTIGAGMQQLYETKELQLLSFDVYSSDHNTFIADAHNIPVKSSSVDAVLIQAVLEHVLNPGIVVSEIERVLKPSGIVYAETPFMQQVHEGAYDFTRFSESGHRWLFKNFQCIKSGPVSGPGTVMIWSIRYFISGIFRTKRAGQLAGLLFFWLRLFDRLIPKKARADGASGVYFLGKKIQNPIKEKDIIAFYSEQA